MAKKVVKKVKTVAAPVQKGNGCCNVCSEQKWNLVPLRMALGLMFFVAGLSKLIMLINDSAQVSGSFASLGIPFPLFAAWLVGIVEILAGLSLVIGFATWPAGLLLGIIMVVATIATSIAGFNWSNLMLHLTFIGALIALMYGNKYFSIGSCCGCCKK
ncbi:MAG: DoxX family protein [Candidatus Nanoarchaeia archaeon]